ncbi:uncharacterized protein LOC108665467 [Hyalella azteca]|uniref:Uncharacterized protein LOC108665467 n=1 Tax=Hyalella azteca TaxID=294128 RepID=A0A8B7N1K3_HYAAZ|nr:uncharacterized protein LOC108665467 [Hyalella azteca]
MRMMKTRQITTLLVILLLPNVRSSDADRPMSENNDSLNGSNRNEGRRYTSGRYVYPSPNQSVNPANAPEDLLELRVQRNRATERRDQVPKFYAHPKYRRPKGTRMPNQDELSRHLNSGVDNLRSGYLNRSTDQESEAGSSFAEDPGPGRMAVTKLDEMLQRLENNNDELLQRLRQERDHFAVSRNRIDRHHEHPGNHHRHNNFPSRYRDNSVHYSDRVLHASSRHGVQRIEDLHDDSERLIKLDRDVAQLEALTPRLSQRPTSRNGLDVSSRNGLNASSRNGLDASSRNGLDASSRNGLDASSRNGLDVSSRNGLDASSRNGLVAPPRNRQDGNEPTVLETDYQDEDASLKNRKTSHRILQQSLVSKDARLVRLASENVRFVMANAQCATPVRRCVDLSANQTTSGKTYWPRCAIVYRCGEDAGCCYSPEHVCSVKESHDIDLHFFYMTFGTEKTGVDKLTFENHTSCECRPRFAFVNGYEYPLHTESRINIRPPHMNQEQQTSAPFMGNHFTQQHQRPAHHSGDTLYQPLASSHQTRNRLTPVHHSGTHHSTLEEDIRFTNFSLPVSTSSDLPSTNYYSPSTLDGTYTSPVTQDMLYNLVSGETNLHSRLSSTAADENFLQTSSTGRSVSSTAMQSGTTRSSTAATTSRTNAMRPSNAVTAAYTSVIGSPVSETISTERSYRQYNDAIIGNSLQLDDDLSQVESAPSIGEFRRHPVVPALVENVLEKDEPQVRIVEQPEMSQESQRWTNEQQGRTRQQIKLSQPADLLAQTYLKNAPLTAKDRNERTTAAVQKDLAAKKECRCPELFVTKANPLQAGACECVCDADRGNCRRLMKGQRYFKPKDERCIMSGECGLPACKFGNFITEYKRCPRKREMKKRRNRTSGT